MQYVWVASISGNPREGHLLGPPSSALLPFYSAHSPFCMLHVVGMHGSCKNDTRVLNTHPSKRTSSASGFCSAIARFVRQKATGMGRPRARMRWHDTSRCSSLVNSPTLEKKRKRRSPKREFILSLRKGGKRKRKGTTA